MSSGPDFSDPVKLEARRLAFFRCCYCREKMGDHVHHLTPKEEGGSRELDNAILLCVQCHADYGHRSDKRAQLRQARDQWYEIVAKRYKHADLDQVQHIASDVAQIKENLQSLSAMIITRLNANTMSPSDAGIVVSTMVSSLATPVRYTRDPNLMPTVFDTPLPLKASVAPPAKEPGAE
jgi:hypothetical protein